MNYEPVTPGELAAHRGPRPGVIALRNFLLFFFANAGARDGGIYNPRTVRGRNTPSMHGTGRALDIMVPDKQTGDLIFLAVAKKAPWNGVQYVIWNRHSWHPGEALKRYTGSNPHTDHLHIELTNKAADTMTVDWLGKVYK
mgnify:FL=1